MKPEKYCAGSRRSAHVLAMLGMSVGDRWSGTVGGWVGTGRLENGGLKGWGERKVEIAPGHDGLSRATSGGLVLYNVSLLLIPPCAESRSLSSSHRGFQARKIAARRRGVPADTRPRRASGGFITSLRAWGEGDGDGADDDGGRRTSLGVRVRFPRFLFFSSPRPLCRLVVTPQIAGRGGDRSGPARAPVLRERPF